MRMNRILGPGLAAALGACTPPPPPVPPAPPPPPAPTADAAGDFRRSAPPPDAEVVYTPPKIEEAKLANGVRVLVVERHELPIVAVEITTVRGADQATPGVGAFAGEMLTQGTKSKSALEFSDAMGKLGASFSSWVGYDSGGVRGQSVTPRLREMLTLLGDAYRSPAFAPAEVERERARRLTQLAELNDRPSSLLSIAQARALYPAAHPYSTPLLGTEEALKKVKPADLARFHAESFRPESTTIAFAGDITRAEALKEAERLLGAWKGAPGPAAAKPVTPAAPPPLAAGAPRVVLVERPGLTQSSVVVALPGVPRSTRDHDAILVLNTLLGGQFSSRLNLNLREKHAYTYGARSSFDMRHGPGPFSAGGAIVRESTGPAVKEILAELERIRKEPVSAEELEDAKTNLIRQLPARFETAGATAATLAGLAVYDLPLDEFATRPARIQRVTREDVQRVAQAYLVPDQLRVLLVADGRVAEQLSSLALGPVSVEKAQGAPADKAALEKAGAKPAADKAAPGKADERPAADKAAATKPAAEKKP
jgi:zinc protease